MSSHPSSQPTDQRFSDQLERWLSSAQPKTLGSLNQAFGEKGPAVTVLLLMILPALPLPTGGITHVFEAFTVILVLPLLAGRRTFWMPGFIERYRLGKVVTGRFVPAMLRLIRRLERVSRPRGARVMRLLPFRIVSAAAIIGLALTAAFAPPFSGLDTLPALGVVIITLGIILDDAIFFAGGIIAGLAGLYTVVFLGTEAARFFRHLL